MTDASGLGLGFRNALDDYDRVESRLELAGLGGDPPLVTIAIPTFRRPAMLRDAIASAIGQAMPRPFEVIILDNDPDGAGPTALEGLPGLTSADVRYYRNAENIGMFGNWNRCIRLARGEWITILNDDDLLDRNFLETMFAELERHPTTDGIVCRKRPFDQRPGRAEPLPDESAPQHVSGRVNWRTAARLLLAGGPGGRRDFARAACGKLELEYMFRGRASRRVTPRTLFFGSVLGNGAGFLFRKRTALAIGGYYEEEFPSADYWFYARMAAHHHLRQHRAVAASVRIAENETARPESVRAALARGHLLQQRLAGSHLPSWWRRLSPLVLAWHRTHFSEVWHADLSDQEFRALLGVPVWRDRPWLLALMRYALRGF